MKRDLCFLHVSLCTCPRPHAALYPPLSVHPDVSLISICPCLCVSGGPLLSLSFHLSHTISHSDVALQKTLPESELVGSCPSAPDPGLLLILLGLEEGWGRVSDLVLEQIRHFTRLGAPWSLPSVLPEV